MRDVSTSLDMTELPEARVADEIRRATTTFIERTRNGSALSNRARST